MSKRIKKNPVKTLDEDAIRELMLYADNESKLYPQKESIIKNLIRKINSGKYNHALAPKLWKYWYDNAAKMYGKEIGGDGAKLFPVAVRKEAAHHKADEEFKSIKLGEWSQLEEMVKPKGKKVKKNPVRPKNPVRLKKVDANKFYVWDIVNNKPSMIGKGYSTEYEANLKKAKEERKRGVALYVDKGKDLLRDEPTFFKNPVRPLKKRDPTYWVITLHSGYLNFQSDSGYTGSQPYNSLAGNTARQKAMSFIKQLGVKRGQYEIIDSNPVRPLKAKAEAQAHLNARKNPVRPLKKRQVFYVVARKGKDKYYYSGQDKLNSDVSKAVYFKSASAADSVKATLEKDYPNYFWITHVSTI